ncbi:MAG: hypothetical protein NC131_10235 [Roseburia sp.]|nr:hypothetical protein [Roseburia sp.]
MNMDKYIPGIAVTAGSWMLKWDLMNQHIHNHHINIQPGDNVNVFINFECIMRNLTMQKGLNGNINYHKQDVVLELESAVLNLMANYRAYFKKEKCNVKLYFYYTDLETPNQEMMLYNKYYRTYYQNRYMQNPQFRNIGDLLIKIIIPEIELILTYVKDCYFIKAKGFDGSIIPQVISLSSNSKNVIITGDIFDTLYMFNPNFCTIYINRKYQHFMTFSEIDGVIQSIIKNESAFDSSIFASEMYYRLLLSIKGSKVRNIKSARGFGYGKFISILKEGMNNNIVLIDFSSLDSIIELFPEKYRADIKEAFQCTSIDTQYELLNNIDIDSIYNQIIDKIDIESVEALNNKRFFNYPINLQSLIY